MSLDRLPPQPWMAAEATRTVVSALQAEGGGDAARFVGGCVRNTLLGAPVDDIDIATPLTPERVLAALERAGVRAAPTGIAHGTVTAISGGQPFEVTTLRRDVETDGRRAVVAFTDNWAEDAARRDFRLNALYAEPDGQLHDPTSAGVDDAVAGRIVFVGDPDTRIREDYLRILRFFRFRAWYGRSEPDADAVAACERLREGMAGLSAERVGKEVLKLLAAPNPHVALREMAQAGVLTQLLPQASLAPDLDTLPAGDPLLRLAALLPLQREAVLDATARLRLSNAQRDRWLAMADAQDVTPGMAPSAYRAGAYRHGAQAVRDRLQLAGAAPSVLDAWAVPTLPVTGADLLARGLAAGPTMGEALRQLEERWIASDFALTREQLLAGL